jgi:hypothetical protein
MAGHGGAIGAGASLPLPVDWSRASEGEHRNLDGFWKLMESQIPFRVSSVKEVGRR